MSLEEQHRNMSQDCLTPKHSPSLGPGDFDMLFRCPAYLPREQWCERCKAKESAT